MTLATAIVTSPSTMIQTKIDNYVENIQFNSNEKRQFITTRCSNSLVSTLKKKTCNYNIINCINQKNFRTEFQRYRQYCSATCTLHFFSKCLHRMSTFFNCCKIEAGNTMQHSPHNFLGQECYLKGTPIIPIISVSEPRKIQIDYEETSDLQQNKQPSLNEIDHTISKSTLYDSNMVNNVEHFCNFINENEETYITRNTKTLVPDYLLENEIKNIENTPILRGDTQQEIENKIDVNKIDYEAQPFSKNDLTMQENIPDEKSYSAPLTTEIPINVEITENEKLHMENSTSPNLFEECEELNLSVTNIFKNAENVCNHSDNNAHLEVEKLVNLHMLLNGEMNEHDCDKQPNFNPDQNVIYVLSSEKNSDYLRKSSEDNSTDDISKGDVAEYQLMNCSDRREDVNDQAEFNNMNTITDSEMIDSKSKRSVVKKRKISTSNKMRNSAVTSIESNKVISQNKIINNQTSQAISTCLNQMESIDWEIIMNGLQLFSHLISNYPDLMEPHIHVLCIFLTKHITNLRSQVSRSACQISAKFFITHTKQLEQDADNLVWSLFNRTADTNKFLRSDATVALESMCDNFTPTKVIHLITSRGANHQNAMVRATSAKLCIRIIRRLGSENILSGNSNNVAINRDCRDRLILTGASFLMEGSLAIRSHAKEMFKLFADQPQYNKIITEIIPFNLYRNIEKTLNNINK